ncbi:MAG: hypothetical protein ACLFSN_04315 [Candidatus Woesearchaeota archaeon]
MDLDGLVQELMRPSARDPPGESGIQTTNSHAFEVKADTIYGLSQIGKVQMVWNHNSESGTGKMNEPTAGDWDANIQDWKQDDYLAMNGEGYKLERQPSGLLTARQPKQLWLPRDKTQIYNETARQAIENNNAATAQTYINKALERETANKDAFTNQAIPLQKMGKRDEALDTYRLAQQATTALRREETLEKTIENYTGATL